MRFCGTFRASEQLSCPKERPQPDRVPCEGINTKETIQKIRAVMPEKPKKFQLSIPDLFEGAVLKMLAKRPDERYASATALLEDLERVGKYQGLST